MADALDAEIARSMPARLVSDPAYRVGVGVGDLVPEHALGRLDAEKYRALNAMSAEMLGRFGAHTRNAVRGILRDGARLQ
jgi:hypothetical protein